MVGLNISCTNIDLDPLTKRYEENFKGDLSAPADIDPTGVNSFSFVVLSDTHIGSPGGEVLKGMLARIQSDGDAFVVSCGDSTDNGAEGQYLQLLTLFSQFNIPFRLALGNHDIFFNGWKNFKKHIGRSMYSFNADNVHITVIDSANGVLGEEQLDWIESDLKLATHEHKIVVTHFPPWNGNFSSIFKMASEEEAAILKDILQRTGVDIIFGGHYHGHRETKLGDVNYVVTGGANDIIDFGNKQHFIRVHVNGASLRTEYVSFP